MIYRDEADKVLRVSVANFALRVWPDDECVLFSITGKSKKEHTLTADTFVDRDDLTLFVKECAEILGLFVSEQPKVEAGR